MSDKANKLQVVAFAVPYPANYGGVIDVFYKLKALADSGLALHLHAFTYGDRQKAPELEEVCEQVRYYPRTRNPIRALDRLPFIVTSRMPSSLLQNLASSRGPILFEGLHCCGFAGHRALDGRQKVLRLHNVEWDYYLHLAQTSSSWSARTFFKMESRKLQRFERLAFGQVDRIVAISEQDYEYCVARHPVVDLVRPFHQFNDVAVEHGRGEYVFYGGDMTIEDNQRTAISLSRVCERAGVPFVLAGRSPHPGGLKQLGERANIEMHFDVSPGEMQQLMARAQIHIVDSSIASGFKLKLLSALYTARHVVARRFLVERGLYGVVNVFDNEEELFRTIKRTWEEPATVATVDERKEVLSPLFSNAANASSLKQILTMV